MKASRRRLWLAADGSSHMAMYAVATGFDWKISLRSRRIVLRLERPSRDCRSELNQQQAPCEDKGIGFGHLVGSKVIMVVVMMVG